MTEFQRDGLISISLANLSLLGIWNAFLNYTPAQAFLMEGGPSRAQYAAALANVLILSVVYFLLLRLTRKSPFASGVVFVLMCLPALKAIMRLISVTYPSVGPREAAVILAAALAVTVVLARRRTLAFAGSLVVALSPLILIEGALAFSRSPARYDAAFADGTLAPRTPNALPRIVWIVFDELDYRLAFPGRPADLALPAFDELRSQSVFAENATAPAFDTVHSVPSLLLGKKLASVEPRGPAAVLFDGIPAARLPSIFSSVRAMGGNAAVNGWYLPHCRLFAQDLAACSWHDIGSDVSETVGTFRESLAAQQQYLLEYGYISPFAQSLRARHRIVMVDALRSAALRDVADPTLNLVFLHLPVPHAPHFYDRKTRTFTKRNAGPEGYIDSLALADSLLAEIRISMTSAGQWDKTTVLVSSDHPDRSARAYDGKTDPRVPFLMKFAGKTSASVYTAPLRTVVTKPLLEAILRGQIKCQEEAVNWLRMNP